MPTSATKRKKSAPFMVAPVSVRPPAATDTNLDGGAGGQRAAPAERHLGDEIRGRGIDRRGGGGQGQRLTEVRRRRRRQRGDGSQRVDGADHGAAIGEADLDGAAGAQLAGVARRQEGAYPRRGIVGEED